MSTLCSSLWKDTSEEGDDEEDLEEEEGGEVSNDCVIHLPGNDLKVRTLDTVTLCYYS